MSTMQTDKDWIQTASGRKFYPLAPRPEDVSIDDIAHALANLCRFAGHTRQFYSVAQHCVIGSWFCARPLDFLLHDASEAYLCDLSRPVKHHADLARYRDAEQRLQSVICQAFGLAWPPPECVKHMDDVMCQTERRDLMPDRPEWTLRVKPLDYRIMPWEPSFAKEMFLFRYQNLVAPFGWYRTIGLVPRDAFALN